MAAPPTDTHGRADSPSDVARLKYVVAFAAENLDYYRAGDWLNCLDNLRGFVAGESDPVLTIRTGGFSQQQTRDLHAEIGLLLRSVATRRIARPAAGGPGIVVQSNRDIPIEAKWSVGAGRIRAIAPTLREAVLLRLIFLLARYGHAKIRPCPECGRLFWRVRRQIYCSRTCVNRVNMRAHVARERDREQRRRVGRGRKGKR